MVLGKQTFHVRHGGLQAGWVRDKIASMQTLPRSFYDRDRLDPYKTVGNKCDAAKNFVSSQKMSCLPNAP